MMVLSIIKFARIKIVITCFAIALVGSVASGGITIKILIALFLVIAMNVHANSINDYADKDIDKINLKKASDRPLLTKDITLNQFWTIHFGSGVLALALSALYGFRGVVLMVAVLFIDYIYSLKPFRLTDKTLTSPILLALTYTYYSFSLGFWSTNNGRGYAWLLSSGICLGFIARLLLKDFRDVKGDKKYGKITFLIRYGAKLTCFASGTFWLLAMLVIGQSTSFATGVILPLSLGSIMVLVWLQELSRVREIDGQQRIIALIAKAGNIAIITILTYLICQQRAGLSAVEIELIPAVIGSALLLLNWFSSSNHRRLVYVRSN